MSAHNPTFEELQGYGYAFLAKTHFTIAEISEQARRHLRIVFSLRGLVNDFKKVLDFLHDKPLMELLSNLQKAELAAVMRKGLDANRSLLATLRYVDLGMWRPLYNGPQRSLESCIDDLSAHVSALEIEDCTVLALSKREQEQVAKLLADPPDPNSKLRKSLEKHTMR
jgi:hypothetical protein